MKQCLLLPLHSLFINLMSRGKLNNGYAKYTFYTQLVTKIMTEWLKQPLIFAVCMHCKKFMVISVSCVIRHCIDRRVGGRETVCLSHVILGDYIIHIFKDEMHMGRNVMHHLLCTYSAFIYLVDIIHMLKMV